MWNYEKRLQYPVKITQTNPKIAQVIISQFGGPDGELAASMRYLSQRYTMPYREVTGILTDIGREASEMLHLPEQSHRNPSCFDLSYLKKPGSKQEGFLYPTVLMYCLKYLSSRICSSIR